MIISIILVTYNSSEYIGPCLDSIYAQDFRDYELIAIDNASKDTTKSIIKSRYPGVILIENAHNLGPSKARNQGIAKAKGEFILCLDSDVTLERDFLINIYRAIKNKEHIGAVQPKVLKRNGKSIDTVGIFLSKNRRFYDIGRGQVDNGRFSRQKYVFGPSSAAALYKRKMLEEVRVNGEYFDEDFFFLVEDVDLAWRANRLGYKTIFSPEAICYHCGNSSKHNFYFRQCLSFRNRYFLMLKNDSLKALLKDIFFILPYEILRIPYFLVANRYSFRALSEIKELLPKMRKKRFLTKEKLKRNA